MKSLKIIFFLCAAWLYHVPGFAQRFWLTTYEFTGGPKMGIASIRDSILLVATHQSVMRSFNQGHSWDTVLVAPEIISIAAHPSGVVLAGGYGEVFQSFDFGETWASSGNLCLDPIAKIAFTNSGNALATTYDWMMNSAEGAGVWWWNKETGEWGSRNNGLADHWAMNQLAVAPDGSAFVTVFDEWGVNGGLYMSTNEGLQWTKVPLSFNGRPVVDNQCNLQFSTGLSISNDSIYLSFNGKAGSVGLRLNLVKALNDINSNTPWQQYRINRGSMFWMDMLLNAIHFAQNGDRYSSHSGTGTYFFNANRWAFTTQGLGDDIFGRLSEQFFTEFSNGKIFMVQHYDERIYWADTSRRITTGVPKPMAVAEWTFSPNPVVGNTMMLHGEKSGWHSFRLRNLQGKVVKDFVQVQAGNPLDIGSLPKGIYLLEVDDKPLKNKLIVN